MDVVQQMLAILLVFALLGLLVWVSRRNAGTVSAPPAGLLAGWFGGGSRPGWAGGLARLLEPMERLQLTPQHAVHLVRAGGRDLVIATHPQGCSLLAEWPANPGAPSISGRSGLGQGGPDLGRTV